jgi:hypothetical protein
LDFSDGGVKGRRALFENVVKEHACLVGWFPFPPFPRTNQSINQSINQTKPTRNFGSIASSLQFDPCPLINWVFDVWIVSDGFRFASNAISSPHESL